MSALGIAIDVLLVLGVVIFFSQASRLLGPRPRHQGDADIPYETGERPIELALPRMSVLYWGFAVLFVIFDVDLAFLLPWALTRPRPSAVEMAAVTGFVAIVGLMLGYFWRKGELECR